MPGAHDASVQSIPHLISLCSIQQIIFRLWSYPQVIHNRQGFLVLLIFSFGKMAGIWKTVLTRLSIWLPCIRSFFLGWVGITASPAFPQISKCGSGFLGSGGCVARHCWCGVMDTHGRIDGERAHTPIGLKVRGKGRL